MTVSPERQGQGIGAALLARALEGYGQRQLRTVTLNTQADNLASQRLYRNCHPPHNSQSSAADRWKQL